MCGIDLAHLPERQLTEHLPRRPHNWSGRPSRLWRSTGLDQSAPRVRRLGLHAHGVYRMLPTLVAPAADSRVTKTTRNRHGSDKDILALHRRKQRLSQLGGWRRYCRPAFIGCTGTADNDSASLLGEPWRISLMSEYERFFDGAPTAKFNIKAVQAGAAAPCRRTETGSRSGSPAAARPEGGNDRGRRHLL